MHKRILKKAVIGIALLTLLAFTGCGAKQSVSPQAVEQSTSPQAAEEKKTEAAEPQPAEKAQAKEPVKVRYGYQPGHAQIVVARELGFLKEEFEKDGVTFEFEKFVSGPPIIEAFAGNRLDVGQVGDQPAIQARANNIDIKAIGVYGIGTKALGLVAAEGSGINAIKDLKGKKVGFVVGSVSHQLLYIYLKSEGLKPDEVKQVNLTPADIVTAITAKNIDAAVVWEPFISSIEANKAGKFVKDAEGYKENVNVIIAGNAFAKKNPEVVSRLLKVLDKAEKWIKENPDKALEIISKDSGFKPEVLKPSFDKTILDLRLTEAAVKSITETAAFLRENNVIRTDVDARELIDDSYLKAAGLQ